MSSNSRRFYDFGPFRLDDSERLLHRGEDVVPLTPKAFEMLLVLVESGGRVMSKEELLTRLWPDSIVEEANLSHNIYKLREALSEGSNGEKFIETLPRRGYRFLPKVTSASDADFEIRIEEHARAHILLEEDDYPKTLETTSSRLLEQRARPARRSNPALVVIPALVLVVAAASIYFWRSRHSEIPATSELRSIAVLPFKPLATTDRDESLEMGMADSLITRLSNIRNLVVRPISAVRTFNMLDTDAIEAGRKLQVDSVLDGHIQRAGDRIRVTVRLMRVSDQKALWTAQFDDDYTDIFDVQDSISQKVAAAVAPKLSADERIRVTRNYTQNTDAYKLYLTGRYLANKMTAEGLQAAVKSYRQAIDIDPNYALAYAGLADAYNTLGVWDFFAEGTEFPEAKAAARPAALKALSIDDALPEAHAALAYAQFRYDWDWQSAEEEFKKAIELNPNQAPSHQLYAEFLIVSRRFAEAQRELARAQELDPLSLYVRMQVAVRLYFMRRYDEAIQQLREVNRMDSSYPIVYGLLWACYRAKGASDEFFAARLQDLRLTGISDGEVNELRFAAKSGIEEFCRKDIELLKAHQSQLQLAPIFIAMITRTLAIRNKH